MRRRDRLVAALRGLVRRDAPRGMPPSVPMEPVHVPSPVPEVRSADLEAIVAALATPRVVHHWATWCEGCVEELPLIEEIHRQLPAPGVLALCWDRFDGRHEPSHATAEAVAAFLGARGATFPTLIVDVPPEALFEALAMDFRQIPQTWRSRSPRERAQVVEGTVDRATMADLLLPMEDP